MNPSETLESLASELPEVISLARIAFLRAKLMHTAGRVRYLEQTVDDKTDKVMKDAPPPEPAWGPNVVRLPVRMQGARL